MQVDPIKPMLKPPGNKQLKLKRDEPLSTSAFRFNVRRYSKGVRVAGMAAALGGTGQSRPSSGRPMSAGPRPTLVGRCRLTL